MKYPLVSIIVPMFNAQKTITLCVDSLLSLKYPKEKIEIIVVDDHSTDKSVSMINGFPIKIMKSEGGTIAAVRNYGAKHAQGEIYGFVDSDCVVHEDWLSAAISYLADPEVAATGSGYLCPDDYTWVEKAWLYESSHQTYETNFITSGNFIIKSNVYKEIEGFNENLITCEDVEIGLRLVQHGYKLLDVANLGITHLGNAKSITSFFKKEVWYGASMLDTLKTSIFDKVLIATSVFALIHLGIAVGLLKIAMNQTFSVLFFSISALIFILLSSAIYRVYRSKKYHLLLETMVLYYFYYLARACAMGKSLSNVIFKI